MGADNMVQPAARVLFVCLGNICRSPTAEGVFRVVADRAGLAGKVRADSAGIGDWHIGLPPDARAIQAAKRRGSLKRPSSKSASLRSARARSSAMPPSGR